MRLLTPLVPSILSILLLQLPASSFAIADPQSASSPICIPRFTIPGVSAADQKYAEIPNPGNLPYCDDSNAGSVSMASTNASTTTPTNGGGGDGGLTLQGGGGAEDLTGCWFDDDAESMKPSTEEQKAQKLQAKGMGGGSTR